jgi:hypothetical protein
MLRVLIHAPLHPSEMSSVHLQRTEVHRVLAIESLWPSSARTEVRDIPEALVRLCPLD